MDAGDYKQLFFFLMGIVVWSVFSELSVRYAIAISDNSGKSLRDSRVYWRKVSQRLLAGFSLFWPSVMVLLALIWCYASATYMTTGVKLLYFGIFVFCLLTVLRLLSYFYFHRKPRNGNDPAQTILGARSLPKYEYDWVNRLYGIYNEYVYTLLKPSNFKGDYKEDMQFFANHIVHSSEEFRAAFLQNDQVMSSQRILPGKFELINKEHIVADRGDSYKWRYRIPNSFYPAFHRQVGLMAVLATVLMIAVSFVPASCSFFGGVGAPALICLAFACYSGMYSGLLFMDYGLFRKNFIPFRWIFLVLLMVVSVVNKDHPVDMSAEANGKRNTMTGQFGTWFPDYKAKMDKTFPGIQKYPVVFICAEGGGFADGGLIPVCS